MRWPATVFAKAIAIFGASGHVSRSRKPLVPAKLLDQQPHVVMGISGSPDAVDSTVDAAEDRLCYICHEPETDDAPFMYGKSELSTAPSGVVRWAAARPLVKKS
jgi:hypothetical protein